MGKKIWVEDNYTEDIDPHYEQILKCLSDNNNTENIRTMGDEYRLIFNREFSNEKENVISWMDIPANDNVLEINAGCGGSTRYLVEKGCKVTCIEKSLVKSKINYVRNENDNLKGIYVGDIIENLEILEETFDSIVVWELPPDKLKKFFEKLSALTNTTSTIYLLFSNMIGVNNICHVREVAGEQYEHMINNNFYSIKYVLELLKKLEFKTPEVYYPYPDYRYMVSIFSEDYLPQENELNRNDYLFEKNLIRLDDIQKLYKNILDKKLFSVLSNAYLLKI